MSTSSSTAIPIASVDPQAIIATFAQAIRPAIAFIVITTILGTILIPLLVLLFALSTPQSRRKPIFILNVVAVSLGIIITAVSLHFQIRSILSPFSNIDRAENLIYFYLDKWLPWFSEAVLLLRIAVVFPRHRLPLLLAFPITVKAGRVAVNILYCYVILSQFPKSLFKADLFLELADNSYVSFLFLWKLGWHRRSQLRSGDLAIERITWSRSKSSKSYASKLQTLFWIASTNFVFPLIFILIEIIMIFVGTEPIIYAGIDVVRSYITIIATTSATVWSSTISFKEAIAQNNTIASSATVLFRMEQTMGTTTTDQESVPPLRTEEGDENVKPTSSW
ncbi:hypothetical protein B0H13DRAFT_1979254 [Mycena leptocephala]|nr:hypothetical protein B0H13DRAFT_1979254 [Mycena leptocephala]